MYYYLLFKLIENYTEKYIYYYTIYQDVNADDSNYSYIYFNILLYRIPSRPLEKVRPTNFQSIVLLYYCYYYQGTNCRDDTVVFIVGGL